MTKTTPAQNKAPVLDAFDNYAAAERLWSDRCIPAQRPADALVGP